MRPVARAAAAYPSAGRCAVFITYSDDAAVRVHTIAPEMMLSVSMDAPGSPASSWDGRFAREGRDRYAEFAKTGLQLIATDRPAETARDLDANDGVPGVGAMRCLTAGSLPR